GVYSGDFPGCYALRLLRGIGQGITYGIMRGVVARRNFLGDHQTRLRVELTLQFQRRTGGAYGIGLVVERRRRRPFPYTLRTRPERRTPIKVVDIRTGQKISPIDR